jgi:outer membrane protein assembly factor BamB
LAPALALVLLTGCASGWKGPKAPVQALPTGGAQVAAVTGPPALEQWTFKSGAFLATSPEAVGHFLAVGDRKGHVQFLDPNSGKKKALIKGKGAIRCRLAWDEERVYLVSEHPGQPVQAYQLEGGKRVWHRKFSGPPEAPIRVGDELWLPVRDTLYALNPETGVTVRTLVAGGDLWETPVATRTGWIVWGRHGALVALGADGARLWSVELNELCDQPPLVSGDTLWLSTTSGTLLCLAGEGEVMFTRTLDSTALFTVALGSQFVFVGAASGELWALSPADGAVQWQRSLGAPLSGAPLVHDNWIAATLKDGRLELLDTDSGASLESITYSSILPFAPTWAFGRLYVVDSDRRVHALGTRP